jgi:pimeloyl-ACP methyl ester carboxylesterase
MALGARGRVVVAPDLLGYGRHRSVPEAAVSLSAQVDELHSCIRHAYGNERVDLVGHSVGGAIAMLLAYREPAMVRRVVSIEGNFTLKDAFWSASLGQMSIPQVATILEGFTSDPAGWLARSGVPATSANLDFARDWLIFQPAATLRAMGRSIVEVTASPAYLESVRRVFDGCDVSLLSGERSYTQWDVPEWALTKARKTVTIAGTGHLMMLEQPSHFIETLEDILS